MMTKNTHHVVPAPNGGWNVKRGGSIRALKHFDNKQDAVDWGRKISRRQESEFVVHGKDGTIQHKENSHGKDPLPLRDKTR